MTARKLRLLGDAARVVDARSSRSTQRKIGASEIGVCRRRAGYSHHRTPPSNPENLTGIAAILGTWLHKGALDTMRREWGSLTEVRVEDDLLRGHVDAVELPEAFVRKLPAKYAHAGPFPDVVEVDDLKSRRDGRMIDYVRNKGPKRGELFQAHLYARLLREGKVTPIKRQAPIAELGPLPVEVIRLRYFSRAGERDEESQEYVYEQAYDQDLADEAWTWVEQVAASKRPEDLPRDEDGPGLSVICDNCPFRTECWGEEGDYAPQAQLIVTDADLAAILAEYDAARLAESTAHQDKARARAILDATRPAIYLPPDSTEGFRLGWGGGKAQDPKPDVEKMMELFRTAGLEVPYREPSTSPRTIQVVRWQVPDAECGKPVGDPEPVPDVDDGLEWVQDRPRGGWTQRTIATGEEIATMTAGQWTKAHPEYVDPRPLCILKKGHSSDCRPASFVVELDLDDDEDDVDEEEAG